MESKGGDCLDKEQEKWAIFWCDLLSPVIYDEIEPELTNQFLKQIADKQITFPDGRIGKPALKTLRRKLNRYREGGFDALARKKRQDRGQPRNIAPEVIDKAIELKKEQPFQDPAQDQPSLVPPLNVSDLVGEDARLVPAREVAERARRQADFGAGHSHGDGNGNLR